MAGLPPGVSRRRFNTALQQFAAAIGSQWVFSSDADLHLYRDAYSPLWGLPGERLASAAIAPASVEQVQQLMRIANEHHIPVFPISTGKNLGYGGSAPNLSGSVVLDLKRMNRILEVDDKNHSALVEPGVSYFDLYRYIQERKLKVWIDCPDPGWGSLIGNALDRGLGYTMPQFRDHFGAHCGMEVVLPNGDLVRTGMGALPNAKTWQQYRYGYGPHVDGLFAQGNYGVVTKMGFWLMPEPEAFLWGSFSTPRHDNLGPLIETITYLENSGIVTGLPGFGSPLFGRPYGDISFVPMDPEVAALINRPQGASIAELEALSRRKNLGYWGGSLRFYGPPAVIRAQWQYAQQKLSALPEISFREVDYVEFPITAEQEARAHKVTYGIPNLSIFGAGPNRATNWGHLFFSPIVPRTAEAVLEVQRVFREAALEVGLPANMLALPGTMLQRAFVLIFIYRITRDPAKDQRTLQQFRRAIEIAAQHGWAEYRAAPALQDEVAAAYSFNNHALRRLHETIKDAVDPNGILAAGRSGIWPRHLRGRK